MRVAKACMLLLTPPRLLDLSLGAFFVILNSVAYVCCYYLLVSNETALHVQHMNFLLVLYGYLQSLLGYTAGIFIARITQMDNKSVEQPLLDEEMMLIQDNTCQNNDNAAL
jgi:hypothetical protein